MATKKNENVNFNDYKYLGFYDSIRTEDLASQIDSLINTTKENIDKVKQYGKSIGIIGHICIVQSCEIMEQLHKEYPLTKVFVPTLYNGLYDGEKLANKLKGFRTKLFEYSKLIDAIHPNTQTVKFLPCGKDKHIYKEFLSILGFNPIRETIHKNGKVTLTYSKVSFTYVLNLLLYKDTGSTNDFLAVMDRKDTRDIIKKFINGYKNRYIGFLLQDIAEYYGLQSGYYVNSNYYILRERIKQITKDLGYKGITWNYEN